MREREREKERKREREKKGERRSSFSALKPVLSMQYIVPRLETVELRWVCFLSLCV